MDDKNETIKELNKEEKGKSTKFITFDEWAAVFEAIQGLYEMVFELTEEVNRLKGDNNEK